MIMLLQVRFHLDPEVSAALLQLLFRTIHGALTINLKSSRSVVQWNGVLIFAEDEAVAFVL